QIRLLLCHPRSLDDPQNKIAKRGPEGFFQGAADGDGDEGVRRFDAGPRHNGAEAFDEVATEGNDGADLDRGEFAVPLDGVAVAEGEEGAFEVDGEVDGAADGDLLGVEVAAVATHAAGEDRFHRRGGADGADHRTNRNAGTGAEVDVAVADFAEDGF